MDKLSKPNNNINIDFNINIVNIINFKTNISWLHKNNNTDKDKNAKNNTNELNRKITINTEKNMSRLVELVEKNNIFVEIYIHLIYFNYY